MDQKIKARASAKQTAKKEEKKNAILNAALKIFSRKGYVSAALDDVAKEAGVAKGTLYLYFKDKEDLFASTIMFVIDRLAERIRENVRESMSPLEILETLAYHQLEFFAGNRNFFRVFQSIIQDDLLKDHKKLFDNLHRRKTELIDYTFSVVERGKETGLIRRDVSTEDIVYSFGGMVMNITRILFHPGREERFDAAEKAKAIMRIALEGIAAKH